MEHARRTVMDCGIPASGETGKKERRRKAGIQASELRGRTQTVLKSLSGMEERRSGGAATAATRHISGAGSSIKRPRLDGSQKTNARATQRVKAIRAALMEVLRGAVGFDMDNGDKKM